MKKKIQKLKVEIEVWGVEVEETHHYPNGHGSGWWKFNYSVKINGKKKKYGELDGSWSSQTLKKFQKSMSDGYPAYLVLERI